MADLLVHNIGELSGFPGSGPVPGWSMDEPVVQRGAAVLVVDGKVRAAGPEDAVWARDDIPDDCPCLDAEGRAVVPGLIDPHTHAVFSGTREFELGMKLKGASYLDILQAGGGIVRTMSETRGSSVSDLIEGMDRRLDRMMAYGTTCVEVKSGYGLDAGSEFRLLEAITGSRHPVERVPTFLGPHAVPPEYRGRSDDYIDAMIEMLPEIARRGLARYADIFCEKGVFTAEQTGRFLAAAKDVGLGLKVHSDEIENLGGTIVGAGLGAVSAEHLLLSGEEDLQALKGAGTVPVLLPGTLLTIFEDRVPPVKRMRELGLPIALATDLNPNCMLESMQTVMALGCYRLRMTPHETLAACTVNAAHAIGLGHRKGRIAPGYDADMVVLKDRTFGMVPYHFGVNHVDTVIIKGDQVIRGQGW